MGKKKKENTAVVDPATRRANVLDELKFIKKNKKIEKAKAKKEENSSDDNNEGKKLPPFFKAVQAKTKAKVKEHIKEKEEKSEGEEKQQRFSFG